MLKSLYIHIPFCKNQCGYCDFYRVIYRRGLAASLVDVLIKQIENLDYSFETIYIGGGTPTILSFDLLKKLLLKLYRKAAADKEFTIEANPDSLTQDKLKLFFDLGVNRISIGCQSFSDRKLAFLERTHTAKQALASVESARKVGFKNISVDLIFGLPAESDKIWQKDLTQAVDLPLGHISLYMLTYEKKTRLFKRMTQKEFIPLSEEKLVFMYKKAISYLKQKKIIQYEISNFAQEGFRCLHNLRYWENESYLGLGPSAVSFFAKKRRKNIASVSEYIRVAARGGEYWESVEELSGLPRARETAALKIRTIEGINLEWFRRKTGFRLESLLSDSLSRLLDKKLIAYDKQKEAIMLTQKGILFADTVSSEFV